MAANQGKIFEEDFKRSAPEGVMIFRIPDPVVRTKDGLAFGGRVPFDYFLFRSPLLYAMELKSTEQTNISFAGSNPMIKEHQIKALLMIDKFDHLRPGFLLNFRRTHGTYFVPVSNMVAYMASSGRLSIDESGANSIGIYIPSWVNRSRLHYDLTPLFKET